MTATDANRFSLRLARHITGRPLGRRPRPQLPRLGRRDVRLLDARGRGRRAPGQHRAGGRPGADHPGRAVQRHRRARAGAGRPGRRRGPRRAGPHQRRHRPARTRLPRCAASTDPRDGHDPDHRRDPHDLRRTGRSDPGLGARPGHARDRQDDRWRHPGRHVRVHRGDRRPDLVVDRPRGLRRGRRRRNPRRLCAVDDRGPGDPDRGDDRRRVRDDDPARRALDGRGRGGHRVTRRPVARHPARLSGPSTTSCRRCRERAPSSSRPATSSSSASSTCTP